MDREELGCEGGVRIGSNVGFFWTQ